MPIPVEHLIAIVPTNNLTLPLRVVCSCQWQYEARTREAAEYWAGQHRGAQLVRGNIVKMAEEVVSDK